MSNDVERLLLLLLAAADDRTCLIIGEAVKGGRRVETSRKRSPIISIPTDVTRVMADAFKACDADPNLRDPDEIVVRVLRPQAE